ncbi:helix-turn-helix domain-containing protein [Lactococcus petauri]|uniref:helix-turn-helix domain-containing protein n=1 Tax=Lactococcus petauri TaxID=1940789 RepID=UPI0022E4B93B|nr:Rgg/GadR/MutR family transcriptional regulator [Lactococcus petauri]
MSDVNFGNSYKTIRKNKGLTQKEVCQDELTIATLSKFENGKSMPSYALISHLLHQVNMSFDEFEYLCSVDDFGEEKQLKLRFDAIITNAEFQAIHDLKMRCEKHLSRTSNKRIEELKDILELYLELHREDFSKKAQEIALKLWNTIAIKKEWYVSELKLLNQILFYFPDNLVFDVADRILERIKEYEAFQNIARLKASILINLSTLYLQHSKIERCEEVSQWAYREAKKLKRYDFISICLIRLGICRKDKKMIEKGINFLQLAGEDTLAQEFREEVSVFYIQTT